MGRLGGNPRRRWCLNCHEWVHRDVGDHLDGDMERRWAVHRELRHRPEDFKLDDHPQAAEIDDELRRILDLYQ